MQPPDSAVFCLDGDDLLWFRSREDAAGFMEAIDVNNSVYACFDPRGHRLFPVVIGSGREEHVVIQETGEDISVGMLNQLSSFVDSIQPRATDRSFDELILAVVKNYKPLS